MKNFPQHIKEKLFYFLEGEISPGEIDEAISSDDLKDFSEKFPEKYLDLISFNFRQTHAKHELKKIIDEWFDEPEYINWLITILLERIIFGNDEVLLIALRRISRLPDIPDIFVGYESETDQIPLKSQYSNYSNEFIKSQLERLEWYRADIKKEARKLLTAIRTQTANNH